MTLTRKTVVVTLGLLLLLLMPLAGCSLLAGDGVTSTATASDQTSSTGEPGTTTPSTSAPTTTSAPTATEPPSSTTSVTVTSTTATTLSGPTTTFEPSPTTTLLPGKNYTVLPTKDKVVALTFDAAYDPAPLKGILAALTEAGADATFFLTGEFVRDFPEQTQLIIEGGYPIGNHSYTHPDFTTISDAKIRSELEKTAAEMVELGVPDPQPLFRAPYGALNKHVLSLIGDEGYVSVYWTIDTLDWKTDRTPEQIRNVVLKNLKPGAIVLMHVGSKQELEVLPGLLEEIKALGYHFVNLRDALPAAED